MNKLNLKQIEENILPLGNQEKYYRDFIFDLLAAYGRSPSNITRLKNGSLNVANDTLKEVAQKNVVYFKPISKGENLYAVIDELKSDSTVVRYSTRFVIVTDYKQLLAIDTKTNETLDIEIKDINKYFTFFLPWAGMEKAQYVAENYADIKAAYKMAKLFDEIVSFNHNVGDVDYYHSLNVFFSRLLFCFFAEDTEIFSKNQFTASIESQTQTDGSDLAEYLNELFFALDAEDKDGYPSHIASFPYVNGGLFHTEHKSPKFNTKARSLILECGKLDWSNINPDIFGSMIQAVVNPGQRAGLGMHYTSVPNIMKTIEPLFLNKLKEEFNKHYDDNKKLQQLLNRISEIKIFDPACGSGNFLVIAYKELRKLEHAILQRQGELGVTNAMLLSHVNIENFYGIEIDDFAHQVAILSLWLAKHQMNIEFKQKFGVEIPLIPLNETGNIVHGNAAQLDWKKVCPNKPKLSTVYPPQQGKLIDNDHQQAELIDVDQKEWDEIYVISNPPYAGSRKQSAMQKKDIDFVFSKITTNYRNMDYVSIWFYKSAKWLGDNNRAAFSLVSVNSISQGLQVSLVWPLILDKELKIDFAHTSFKWENSAKGGAGVTCVIIAMSRRNVRERYIFTDLIRKSVHEITPYLTDATNDVIVATRQKPLSDLPEMNFGNMPADGGNLILSKEEKRNLLQSSPKAEEFIYELIGARELIQAKNQRWCLWLIRATQQDINQIPEIKKRVEAVRLIRLRSSRPKLASTPHLFAQITCDPTKYDMAIVVPGVSSERREYIPIRLAGKYEVIANSCLAVAGASLHHFALLTSRMHMVWLRAVGGKMKTDFRYSKDIVYNNFPVPPLTKEDKDNIESKAFNVLDAREHHSEQTLAELYDPDKMPEDLRAAHRELDEVIDRVYRKKPFENDKERLSHLFNLYEQVIAKEKEGAIA